MALLPRPATWDGNVGNVEEFGGWCLAWLSFAYYPRPVVRCVPCGVRIHASSFSGVDRRTLIVVDCSIRGRAPSCGVIVSPVVCPASAAVAAATGRPSATTRSFCRLRQSDLTCFFVSQQKHSVSVARLLAIVFALDRCRVSA